MIYEFIEFEKIKKEQDKEREELKEIIIKVKTKVKELLNILEGSD